MFNILFILIFGIICCLYCFIILSGMKNKYPDLDNTKIAENPMDLFKLTITTIIGVAGIIFVLMGVYSLFKY